MIGDIQIDMTLYTVDDNFLHIICISRYLQFWYRIYASRLKEGWHWLLLEIRLCLILVDQDVLDTGPFASDLEINDSLTQLVECVF